MLRQLQVYLMRHSILWLLSSENRSAYLKLGDCSKTVYRCNAEFNHAKFAYVSVGFVPHFSIPAFSSCAFYLCRILIVPYEGSTFSKMVEEGLNPTLVTSSVGVAEPRTWRVDNYNTGKLE